MFFDPMSNFTIEKDVANTISSLKDKFKNNCTYTEMREANKSTKKPLGKTKKVFIGSNKGGVGKSYLSFELAWTLNALGYKVLLCDFDAQANLTCSMIPDEVGKFEADSGLYELLTGEATKEEVIHNISDGLDLFGGNQKVSEIDYFLREEEAKTEIDVIDKLTGEEDEEVSSIYKSSVDLFESFCTPYDFVIFDTNPETNRLNRLSMQVSDLFLIPVEPKNSSLKAFKVTSSEVAGSFESIERGLDGIQDMVKIVLNISREIPASRTEKVMRMFNKQALEFCLGVTIGYCYEAGEAAEEGWPMWGNPNVPLRAVENVVQFTESVIEILSDEKDANETNFINRNRPNFL